MRGPAREIAQRGECRTYFSIEGDGEKVDSKGGLVELNTEVYRWIVVGVGWRSLLNIRVFSYFIILGKMLRYVMSRLSYIIKLITPPILISLYRAMVRRDRGGETKWHQIGSGPCQGLYLYINSDGYKDQMGPDYDRKSWDIINNLDLQGGIVVDVGAHIGFYTLAFARIVGPEGKVYAFEPNEANYERLNLNITRNEMSNLIHTEKTAVGEVSGFTEFSTSNDIESGYSCGGFIENSDVPLTLDVYEKARFNSKSIRVEPLSNLIPEIEWNNLRLVKIDVEGAEYMVLIGMLDILQSAKPRLLIEVHSVTAMYKTIVLLNKIKYHTKLIDFDGPSRCFILAWKET